MNEEGDVCGKQWSVLMQEAGTKGLLCATSNRFFTSKFSQQLI